MHLPHPPSPLAGCRPAITRIWDGPSPLAPFLEATPADTMHDFLVAVPRPDFVSVPLLPRIEKTYTFDLP